MLLNLLIDESVDFRLTSFLPNQLCQWTVIVTESPGMTDLEVLNLAHSTKSILLTEDSDFGEWVFVHKAETSGIIFLRYRPEEIKRIGNTLRQVLHEKQDSLYKKYVVLTPDKIRIRTL